MATLKQSLGTWYTVRASDPEAAERVGRRLGLDDVARDGDELRFGRPRRPWSSSSRSLPARASASAALVPQQATLEDLFFQLTEPGGHQPLAPLPGLEAVT